MDPGPNSSSTCGGGAGVVPAEEPDSSFGYGLNYNPVDPYNMYPHYQTGEEVYGPPPMFGYNPHDPMNMKPFNPNMLGGLFGAPVAPPAPMAPVALPPTATMGPNPFTPLLQPMTPQPPLAPQPMVHQPMNPLMLAALASAGSSSFAPAGADPSSSFAGGAGSDPSSSYYYPYSSPYFYDPFAVQHAVPQHPHPTDPNNQYPNPLTGSMTDPGPALAGGYNVFDPQNLIGAPQAANDRQRAIEHNRAAMQPQSPYAPYRMPQVPVPMPQDRALQ